MFNFNLPTKIYFGNQVSQRLPDLLESGTEKVLLVTSEDVISYAQGVQNTLTAAGLSLSRVLMETGEPTCSYIDQTAKDLQSQEFHYIIGLGGGSAIDLAKALAIALKNPEPIWNYANLSNRPPSDMVSSPLPVIALPTTAGTGSEVTPYAVLGKTDTKQKGTVQDSSIFPQMALIDPSFHVSLPPTLTASTGIDAFAHAFEAYINVSKETPVAEWAGAEAIRHIFKHLKTAFKNPENLVARIGMAWASTLAGIAIAHRGTTTPHAIAEPVGALFKIPHSLAVSSCTLPVLKHTKDNIAHKLSYLNMLISGEESQRGTTDQDFVEKLEDLIQTIGLDIRLKEITDVPEDSVDLVYDNVMKFKSRPLKQHPVMFNEAELKTIIREIIYG
jgi:alcohol dehydrogenase class IV